MMKKMIAVGLMLTALIALSGCHSESPQPEKSVAEVPDSSFSESNGTNSVEEITKSPVMETQKESIAPEAPEDTEETEITAEPEAPTVSDKTEIPKSEDTEKQDEPENNPKPTTPQTPEVVNPPKPSEPIDTDSGESETETPPILPVETEPAEPDFDIAYWIGYAKDYAVGIGLELDETAVDCWDNPITANAKCKNLEADIVSRLNRYKNIEGFSYVWIWAEKVSDTEYELYIGYA